MGFLTLLLPFAALAAPGPVAPPAPAPRVEAAVAQAPAGRSEADLKTAIELMQKTYEDTRDFSATFEQRYTYTVLRRTQTSKGTVRFKKPGQMRWDYTAPVPKHFVVDSGKLWIVQPEDNLAMVDHCFKQDGLTASVSFLWGSGNINEQFNVSWFAGVFGKKTDAHILLIPKKPNGVFAKLILVIDPASHRVKQSIVVDPAGNVNQFVYTDLKYNGGLSKDAFAPPLSKNTHTSRVPGSCNPG